MWKRSVTVLSSLKHPNLREIEKKIALSTQSNFRQSIFCQQNYRYLSTKVKPSESAPRKIKIGDDSWAAEDLERKGEKLEPVLQTKPLRLITENTINEPPEHVVKLVDEILSLNMLEIHDFMSSINDRLGFTPEMLGMGGGGGGGAAANTAAASAPVKEEKTTFDIKLGTVDAKAKIKIIKEVRTITGLGLKEAKELVEKAPVVIKEGVKKEEAESFKKLLVDAGAEVILA